MHHTHCLLTHIWYRRPLPECFFLKKYRLSAPYFQSRYPGIHCQHISQKYQLQPHNPEYIPILQPRNSSCPAVIDIHTITANIMQHTNTIPPFQYRVFPRNTVLHIVADLIPDVLSDPQLPAATKCQLFIDTAHRIPLLDQHCCPGQIPQSESEQLLLLPNDSGIVPSILPYRICHSIQKLPSRLCLFHAYPYRFSTAKLLLQKQQFLLCPVLFRKEKFPVSLFIINGKHIAHAILRTASPYASLLLYTPEARKCYLL